MKRETKILLFLFVLALLVRIVFVFSSPLKIWDETVYANLGYGLSKNPFHYSLSDRGWSDFIPSGGDPLYSWPRIGFRAPLLPYSLSVLYFLNLESLVSFFIPLVGALSVILVYILGKKLFNKNVGIYSAIFLLLLPLHVIYSGKILTGIFFTFFVLLTFLSFWKGYEEGDNKYKILFGFFLALSLLARYTALWIMPIFLIYFLVKYKSLRFIKNKYIWYGVLIFFITLTPWFIYGISEYDNPIGAFIHGGKASAYWGGIQSWYFFFQYGWQMSIVGLIFILSLGYILYKKEFLKKEIYLLLIWIIFFLGMAIIMPHKESRFILPILPAVCLLSGFLISKINKYRKIFLVAVVLVLISSLYFCFLHTYKASYTEVNLCFFEGNMFLKDINEDSLIITDESSVIYYYTKKETHFYPNPWSLGSLEELIESNYKDKKVYIFFTDSDMPLNEEKHIQMKKDLDGNFEKVFDCKNKTVIYKYG